MPISTDNLIWIGRQLNIYIGSFMLLVGLIGSAINLWLFSRRRLQRKPCSQFVLVASLFDMIHLIVGLLLRILAYGLHIDPAASSLVGCRIRYYLITFSAYCALGCRCLAAVDRFAYTSRSVKLRQWSSIKIARCLIASNIVLWALFAVPNLILFELIPVSPTNRICSIKIRTYYYYAYFVNPIVYFAIPLVILIVFAIKTQRNVRLMRNDRLTQRIERQLTSMIVLQSIVYLISSVPYGIQSIYAAATLNSAKDIHQIAIEKLFFQITYLSYYMNTIAPFYIYILSSPEIRKMLKRVLTRKHELTMSGQNQPLSDDDITLERSTLNIRFRKRMLIVTYESYV